MKKNSKVMPKLGNLRNFVGRVVSKNDKMNVAYVEFKQGENKFIKPFSQDVLQIVG